MGALKYYSKVECFGFNFNQNIDVDKHYFEESDKTGGTHDFHQEHSFIKNLHVNSQLSLFDTLNEAPLQSVMSEKLNNPND